MKTKNQSKALHRKPRQRGAALIILMLAIVLSLVTLVTFRSERKGPEQEAQRKTALALAQAKEALLGYAAMDSNHPGSLPCPDANDDGTSDIYDYSGIYCKAPVGRLPWKLIRLQDIRDGSGERLWYAVSHAFNANSGIMLNSANSGQITIRDASGAIIHDANTNNGVVAVIMAPGVVLMRQGATSPQNRSCSVGVNCDTQLVCYSPFISVPKCNPINYLDSTPVEDNQDFVAGTTNGFIAGIILDASGNSVVNDRMITITAKELFTVVTFRMARELANENRIFPQTATTIAGLAKPPVWSANNWDAAIDGDGTTSNVTPSKITLKFTNCAITYTITEPNNVGRDGNSC